MDVQSLRETLQKEVRDLELEAVRIEERLAEKQRMLNRLGEAQTEKITAAPLLSPIREPARKTITALGRHHYELGNLTFKYPGQVLDHFGVPHYYSKQNSGKDAASREILRWATQDPNQARTVTVVLANGTKMDLHLATSNL